MSTNKITVETNKYGKMEYSGKPIFRLPVSTVSRTPETRSRGSFFLIKCPTTGKHVSLSKDLEKKASDFYSKETKKKFEVDNQFTNSSSSVLINFNNKTSFKIIDTKKTTNPQKPKYKTLHGNEYKKYMGVDSVITLDVKPRLYYNKKNNTLNTMVLDAINVRIIKSCKNNLSSTRTRTSHSIISRENGCHMIFSENLQYEDIKKGLDVSIVKVDDYKESSLLFSKVVNRNDRKNIYINYPRKSNGAFYLQADNVVVGYVMTPNEDYDTRGLMLYSCEQNDKLITIFGSMFNTLLKQLYNQRTHIYEDGEELSQEDINCMHSNPLYSPSDENKERPRLSLKFNRNQEGNPKFGLYTITNNTLSEVKVDNDFKSIETLIDQGTVITSLLLNIRVSIVNENVYLTSRIEELLIDTSLPPVFVPKMNKFSFPDTKEHNIVYSYVKRAETPVEYLPDVKFSYNTENKSIDIQPKRIALDVDILYTATITEENDLNDTNKYANRVKFKLNEQLKAYFKNMNKNLYELFTTHSRQLLKQKLTAKAIKKKVSGLLSKKDYEVEEDGKQVKKTVEYGKLKLPVYETKSGVDKIDMKVYTLSHEDDTSVLISEKIEKDDIPIIFSQNATLKIIVDLNLTDKNSKWFLTASVLQVLQEKGSLSSNMAEELNFEDNDYITNNLSDIMQQNFEDNNSSVELENNLTEEQDVPEELEEFLNKDNNESSDDDDDFALNADSLSSSSDSE